LETPIGTKGVVVTFISGWYLQPGLKIDAHFFALIPTHPFPHAEKMSKKVNKNDKNLKLKKIL
jgi:hypothetical protein